MLTFALTALACAPSSPRRRPGVARSRRRFAWSLVVLAIFAVPAQASTSQVDPAVLDDVYREQNIQRQLPIGAPPTLPARGLPIPVAFAWILLGAAVVGTAALALWLVGYKLDGVAPSRRSRREQQPELDPEGADSEPAVPADWLRMADDLARQGRFGEAIHLLLLGVLGTLGLADPSSQATTAREIARRNAGLLRERLTALVLASELVHFGGRSASREQFDRCRRDAEEIDNAVAPGVA
ncbi:MAG: hypothetical protein OXH09_18310 [Gammaproteobacteria bacterium]|nr:hypothetical protein [Gammaproteobacteria bacterium]